jgi:hypothetical protein
MREDALKQFFSISLVFIHFVVKGHCSVLYYQILGYITTFVQHCTLYSVSSLTWNSPRQHAAAAASKLPGNEFVTTRNIVVAYLLVGSDLSGTLCM